MKYVVDKRDSYVIIEPAVEKLMSSNSPKLKTEITLISTEGYNKLILDLNQVTFVDSSGLSSILLANRICKENGGALALCNLNLSAQKLITISQLDDVLNTFTSLEEAVKFIEEY